MMMMMMLVLALKVCYCTLLDYLDATLEAFILIYQSLIKRLF